MDQQNNFFDKKTIYAGIIVFAVLMLWQNHLNKKYRTTSDPAVAQAASIPAEALPAAPVDQVTKSEEKDVATTTNTVPAISLPDEKKITFETKDHRFSISSYGMAIKDFTLNSHTDRDKNPIKLGVTKDGMFALGSLNQFGNLVFTIEKISDVSVRGIAEVAGAKIERVLTYDEATNAFKNTVNIQGLNPEFKGLTLTNSEKSIGFVEQSIFFPTFESQEVVTVQGGKEERVRSSALKEKVEQEFSNVRLVGISSHYFTSSMVDKSDVAPDLKVLAGSGVDEIVTQLTYKPALTSKSEMKLEWINYAGGKSISVLEKVDKDLKHVLDLGIFSSLGILQMYAMQWFHSVIPNWGVAIILLTLLVRLIVLPLNISTFRSTKKMQEVQPQITALRERYKDDPQALNREMLSVWKENKINPFGGCLPMLLQLPVFFALYQVLGQSIELYQAPFLGWIHDLSQKDPFYVLPALMAVAMFIQQKITPTATMDPTQAKMMQFLPLIFALMMINLPAGLTLYIFVNTLAGILLQQMTTAKKTTVPSK
jgi:YidC/Oxa1 family membrane protein insertase